MLYMPPAFKVEDLGILQDHIERTGLATLITGGRDGPIISHVPLFLNRGTDGMGILTGHLARANPQVKHSDLHQKAVAVFQGPEAYISPSWYASKREHGRVVPTWNYAVVHARGTLTFFDEPERLHAAVERLTAIHEARFAKPWTTGDAPREFIAAQLRGIIGISITIESLEGKYKLSQNRPVTDQDGVREGLDAIGEPGPSAASDLMRKVSGLPTA